jgi:predicted metal-dependent hydrolase
MQITLPGFLHPPLPEPFSDHLIIEGRSYRYTISYDREISGIIHEVSQDGNLLITAPPSLTAAEIRRFVQRDGKTLIGILPEKPIPVSRDEQSFFQLGDEQIPYRIRINTSARDMILKISPLLQVSVVVPPRYSRTDLLTFLETNKDWIAEQIGRSDLVSRNKYPVATITVVDHIIEYHIRTSSRAKRITLKILAEGTIEVVAPPGTEPTIIHTFVSKNANWILKKTSTNRRPASQIREYRDGDLLPLLGKTVTLSVKIGESEYRTFFADEIITVHIPDGTEPLVIRGLVRRAYKQVLKQTLQTTSKGMVTRWSVKLGITEPHVKFGDQKTRWGVCTQNGIILNIKLAMAPVDLIEYVVIHELCHIRHRNHSSRFWSLVGQMLPDYVQLRSCLKQNGNLYQL